MIDQITGIVTAQYEKSIQVTLHGCGFLVFVARPTEYLLNEPTEVLTYFHWNQDRGPALYGFSTSLDRSFFLQLIDVPKIGPTLALQLMAQAPTSMLIQNIQAEDIKKLSGYHGLGAKKAEQIIYSLKEKIRELLPLVPTSGINAQQQESSKLYDVLVSLGYSKQEVSAALTHVNGLDQSFDHLLRSALGYLSKNKML